MAERPFGPYRLVHQIAVGGMAEIHLAKTGGIAGFEKYVALKMIHPNFSQDEQFIQMLIDEAKITVQLQHVNIAQTFDLGRVGDTYYITLEYVDGCDLYQLLRRAAERDIDMPMDVAAFIAKEVATGLDYAHRKRDHNGRPLGIVHRDVSPQNVLLSHAGEVKLVDFGIAKATMRARQTAVGVIKGKYYYMSPEQAWGDTVDHRSDIFSTGILLYEMLTGRMLYLEEDMNQLLAMVRRADIAPPTTLRRDIPPQLERIVMHCLQKNPDDRYRSAAELATDLERFLHVYSPVFSASKLAKFMADVLGDGLTPPPVEEPSPQARSAAHITRRLDQSDLVRSRDEFTDENSVIFRVQDMARHMAGADGGGRSPRSTTREVDASDFDDDRTIIDDGPPAFAGVAGAADTVVDDEDDGTTGVRTPAAPAYDDEVTVARAPAGAAGGDDPLEAETVRHPSRLPLRPIPRAPAPPTAALDARVPRPAVSAVRRPRQSRRTPAEGVPAAGDRTPIAALIEEAIAAGPTQTREPGAFAPDEQPTVDALPAALRRGRQTGAQHAPGAPAAAAAPAIASAAVPPLAGGGAPGIPPAFSPPPGAGATARVRALDADALPDAFRVGRPARLPRWVWRAALAAACVAAGVGIGVVALDGGTAPPSAAIEVVSIPEGATVTVNGARQPGVTPLVVGGVHPGTRYRIEVERPGFRRWQRDEEIPVEGGRVTVIAALKPVLVTLHVESTPPDAEVFLNGRSVGRTPLTLSDLDPSAAETIELRRPGYRPERRRLDWSERTEQRQQFTLRR
ncbi:MAG: PEGA domain-containing protein [Deltaproteobacteria bacterium]|nr:MAG: PEGA domain-containing protein [Deltaproteobacteria bacterium]